MRPEQRYRLMESAIGIIQEVIIDILEEDAATDYPGQAIWPEYIAAKAGVRGKTYDTNFIRFLAEDMARQGVLESSGDGNAHRWRLLIPGSQPG